MKSLFFVTLLALSFSSFANTEESLLVQEFDREVDICIDQDSTSIGMRICLANQSEQLDALLNTTYQKLRAKLDGEAETRLVKSQRDWLKYRNSNCEFEGSTVIGGTAETIIIMDCSNRMTAKKIIQLAERLSYPE